MARNLFLDLFVLFQLSLFLVFVNPSARPENTVDESDSDILALNTNKLLLAYGYDKQAKEYLYCEFISMKRKDLPENMRFNNPECYKRNKHMVMNYEGSPYFAFLSFSHGQNGMLAECPSPANVTLHNCTNQNFVYSACSYECPKGQVPQNSTAICKLNGPMHDVRSEWSYIGCMESNIGRKREKDDDEDDNGGDHLTIVVSVPVLTIVTLAIPLFCLVKHLRRRRYRGCGRERSISLQTGVEDGKDLNQPDNADNNNNAEGDRLTDGGDFDPPPEPVPTNGAVGPQNGSNQETAFSDLAERLYGSGRAIPFAPSDHLMKQDKDEAGKLMNVAEQDEDEVRKLMEGLKSSGSMDSLDRDDVKCTTSVKLLLQQLKDYLKEFVEYVEVVDVEENTMKGLAKKWHKEFGFSCERGVDVLYAQVSHEEPCIRILKKMSEQGIAIGFMVDYFTGENQLKHLLKIHSECKYCLRVAKRKNVQPPVMENVDDVARDIDEDT